MIKPGLLCLGAMLLVALSASPTLAAKKPAPQPTTKLQQVDTSEVQQTTFADVGEEVSEEEHHFALH